MALLSSPALHSLCAWPTQPIWRDGSSSSRRTAPVTTALRLPSGSCQTTRRRLTTLARAADGRQGPDNDKEAPEERPMTTEEKLAALEARLGKGPRKVTPAAAPAASTGGSSTSTSTSTSKSSKKKRQEPAAPPAASAAPISVTVENESVKRLVEWWLAKDGGLATLNDWAYKSVYVLAGAWILFRFIGPALGLYQLEDPLLPPSN